MIFPLSVIGFVAVMVQILLLRELVTVFNGNELTYGISLMIWLAAISLGSFLAGKTAKYFKDPLKALIYIE
jgi:spermidine synthase